MIATIDPAAPSRPDITDAALELLNFAVILRLATDLGCPRLASRAARRASATAARLTILLATTVHAVPADLEVARLADVTCTGDLAALLSKGAGS